MSLADPRLTRRRHSAPPSLTLWEEIRLPLCRAHEFCGRARRTLAVFLAGQIPRQDGQPVLWIAPAWSRALPNPDGMRGMACPGNMIFATPSRGEDMLWCVEEALRSGVVPLVIADMETPPGMTQVRRLHLAAEAGAGFGRCRPVAVLLTPEGGAQGIETRFEMQPDHRPGKAVWRLTRQRARLEPPKSWQVENGKTLICA